MAGLSSMPGTPMACREDRTAPQEAPFLLVGKWQPLDHEQARVAKKQFKEIRKEWKQRKKEEEAQRKSEDERQRGSQGGQSVDGQSNDPAQTPTGQNYAPGARPHLPPIGYAPAGGAMQPQYASGVEQMYQAQGNGQVYAGYPPHSPYGQGQQM
ncbi:MAG: hypothetical protein Q9209_000878 [Squamulea sp. 1 TL-2023]